MRVSIKIKLSLFLAMLLLLTVSVLSILILHGMRTDQQKQYEQELRRQGKAANLYIRQATFTDPRESKQYLTERGKELARQLGLTSGMHVILYDQNGKEIGNSLPTASKINLTNILPYALKGQTVYQIDGDTLSFFTPLHDIKEQIGVIQFHYSLKESLDYYNRTESLFYRIGGGVLIFSFLVGYVYFNRLAVGILKLEKTTEQIKIGQYISKPPLQRKDELGTLSQGIYYMSSEIEKNISTMEEEQEKLELAVNKLRGLDEQQKQFIGNVTHEFKTPLTVIMAYLELIEMYSDDPELWEDAKENIQKETNRLVKMVEKILHLATIEKYDFESQMEQVEVKKILEELCERIRIKAQKYGLRLDTDLESAVIWADQENLTHIFINLLDNAIKYNEPHGKIVVKSYVDHQRVWIQVSDTGIGIPLEMKEKVFEPFYTVNKDRSKEFGGTGLGLALVKKLVENQAGTIHLIETEGKGTTICVSFPLYTDEHVQGSIHDES
ncbi:sensor histidine kinase [Baia soyae]|uniref:histidine kinase n=1 Tax=Baia soyae TaxID=1544746 RepID=A0A4R2S1I6_9BACL|nr:HAMP domain-containing sensor histidine kinase [Baia soyae]TCP69373.1 signal transduction histidine kinase [Baia soyae]